MNFVSGPQKLEIMGEVTLALQDGAIIDDDDDDDCFQLLPKNCLIKFKKVKKCQNQIRTKSSQLTISFQDGKMGFGSPIEVVIFMI